MAIYASIKSIPPDEKTPIYGHSYTVSSALAIRIPLLQEVLFLGPLPHDVSHNDSRLSIIVRELDKVLGDYKPTTILGEVSKQPTEHEIKNATYELRKVINYAIQNRKDIHIS